MIGFLISAIIVNVLILFLWLLSKSIDGSRLAGVGACFIIFIVLGLTINSAIKSEAEGPCHEYETQLMFNAATKTMMPSRVCVLRGEWVGDGNEKI